MRAAYQGKGLLIIQGAGLRNCIINPKTRKAELQRELTIVFRLGALRQVIAPVIADAS